MLDTAPIRSAIASRRRSRAPSLADRVAKLLALGSLLLIVDGNLASAATYYVATNGNDSASGDIDHPFATLEKARDALRQLTSAGPLSDGATVYVRGGIYYRTNTFNLDASDSGLNANAPIVFQAYANEKPFLLGGLSITNFGSWTGSILQADVGAQGFQGIYFRQLLFNGSRQQLARYPNYVPRDPYGSGWSYVDGALVDMYSTQDGDSKTSFTYKAGDVHTWTNAAAAEVFIFPRYNWWNNIVPVSAIDTTNRVISLAKNTSYAIRPGDRYYVRNVLDELDAPGEWYLDNQKWLLYFWPPSIITGNLQAYAPVIRTILSLGPGTANVTFRGFRLECSEGTAITLNATTNCVIAANTIANVGDYDGSGIQVSGGFNNGVVGNDISQVGKNGITISGGDTATLTPAQNYADNNYIHHVGVFFKEGVGIQLTGVGNRASHNLIHDAPRFGIYFQGQNLVIEYNHVRNVMLETDDGGIIYTEGIDWLGSRGSVIRYNYFHDSDGWGFYSGVRGVPCSSYGIYLDALSCGVDVIGNLVVRSSGAGVFVNGGSDNRVINNIVSECLHPAGAVLGNEQFHLTCFTTNSSTWTDKVDTLNAGYYSVYDEPAWAGMPGMEMAPGDHYYGAGGITMFSNVFYQNIVTFTNSASSGYAYHCWDVGYESTRFSSNAVYHYGDSVQIRTNLDVITWDTWQAINEDVGSATNDPLFNNPASGDYTVKTNSPALSLGFVQLPIKQIGPYQDGLRASWPIVEAPGAREGFQAPAPPTALRVVPPSQNILGVVF